MTFRHVLCATLLLVLTACKSPNPAGQPAQPCAETLAPRQSILETATANPQLTTWVKLVQAAALVDTLSGPGPFTVFAPTNSAFAKLPPGKLDDLLKSNSKPALRNLLLHHVHSGATTLDAKLSPMQLDALAGNPLNISRNASVITVNKAKVLQPNLVCTNGVIHCIDQVLAP